MPPLTNIVDSKNLKLYIFKESNLVCLILLANRFFF